MTSTEEESGTAGLKILAAAETAEASGIAGSASSIVTSINVYGFTIGVFAIILLSKIASFLTPYKLYFSFTSMLFDDRAAFKWEALVIKLLIPCITGFLLFYLPYRWMLWTRGSTINYRRLFRYLRNEARLTATASAFFAALLSAWPFVVYWDVLQRPDLIAMRLPFLFVYLLYFCSYAYFAGVGVSLALVLLRKQLPTALTFDASQRVSWLNTIRLSFMGIITSGIATYLASILSHAG